MSNPTPPPMNQGTNCPNCGAYRPAGQVYCANCGYGQPPPTSGGGSSPYLALWIVLFIIIGLPAGCLGGCFLLAAGSSGSYTNRPDYLGFLAIGLVGVVVFIGLLVALIRSAKKK